MHEHITKFLEPPDDDDLYTFRMHFAENTHNSNEIALCGKNEGERESIKGVERDGYSEGNR